MGEGGAVPLPRAVQEARRPRLSRPQQAGGVRRPGARLQLRADDGGGTRRDPLRRRADGDDYVINGGKMWITNGVKADWICLLANTSDGPAHRNKSLICVPMKSKGVQV